MNSNMQSMQSMNSTPVKAPPSMDTGLASFDYPSIEELDPSLVDSHQLFYEREVPIELRSANSIDSPTEVGALEAIRVKVLVRGDPSRPESVRVELSSESNLFFHYYHDMTAQHFAQIQEAQRLMVQFQDYPAVLVRMLNSCIKEPHIHLAVFVMQPNGDARLDFIQNMEYKFVELLSAEFRASSEEAVRMHVSYRYNVVRARLALLQNRLADVDTLVKIKSPSLHVQLQRTYPRMPGMPAPSPSKSSQPFR